MNVLQSELVFEPGSYSEALTHYGDCKNWALECGLCSDIGLCGIIRSPELPGRDAEDYLIDYPDSQIHGWVQKVILKYNADRRPMLLTLDLPPGAHWEGDLAQPKVS